MYPNASAPLKAAFSITLIVLSLSACTVGNVHNSKGIEDISSQAQAQDVIKPGMTMSEVQSSLGNPGSRNTYGGKTIWGYQINSLNLNNPRRVLAMAIGAPVQHDTKSVFVHFNDQSLVERVEFSQLSF